MKNRAAEETDKVFFMKAGKILCRDKIEIKAKGYYGSNIFGDELIGFS